MCVLDSDHWNHHMRPHDMKYFGFKHQRENKQNCDKIIKRCFFKTRGRFSVISHRRAKFLSHLSSMRDDREKSSRFKKHRQSLIKYKILKFYEN